MRIQGGLSLVEVLITLALAGLLLTFAVPSFQSLQARRARDAALAALTNDFALARSEAVKRGHSVTVCPSGDGTQCLAATSTNGWEWKQGWIVHLSPSGGSSTGSSSGSTGGGATSPAPAANSPGLVVLHVQGQVPGIQSILSSKSALQFGPTGISSGATANFAVIPSADASRKRLLCISIAGRARLADEGSATCADD